MKTEFIEVVVRTKQADKLNDFSPALLVEVIKLPAEIQLKNVYGDLINVSTLYVYKTKKTKNRDLDSLFPADYFGNSVNLGMWQCYYDNDNNTLFYPIVLNYPTLVNDIIKKYL